MQSAASDRYLTDQVTTASPQKLQLLLIDGTIRHAQRAKALWQEEEWEEGCESLLRAQEIVTEAMTGLQTDSSEFAKKLAGLYIFIFRRLVESHVRRDPKALTEALRVLESERETWRQVCEKFGSTKSESNVRVDSPEGVRPSVMGERSATAKEVAMPSVEMDNSEEISGFSLEA